MNKNSVLFVVFSAIVLFGYFFFVQPKKPAEQNAQTQQTQQTANNGSNVSGRTSSKDFGAAGENKGSKEILTSVNSDNYKIVFTNKGAGIVSWQIKERNGQWINLVFDSSTPVMTNFPEAAYVKIPQKAANRIAYKYESSAGWKIIKTYELSSNSFMHNVSISLVKTKPSAILPTVALSWGPGLGTDAKELSENHAQTRVIALNSQTGSVKTFKTDSASAGQFKWAGIDNRYFLVAFIPTNPSDFSEVVPVRADKKAEPVVQLTVVPSLTESSQSFYADFYAGPKGFTYLRSYNMGLEKSVNFGFFGFLGKIALAVLYFLHQITGNFGWSIVLLTCIIQILVLPLTIKSFRSAAAMKRIQPVIKDIQTKFKDNPQRLQAEMMNAYKSNKVNPLGGCLPMLLQLPIFWAFFTMLRNAYELRNAPWILWVKDLSMADHFLYIGANVPFVGSYINLLPIIMCVLMFFQQKMTTATSDPTQKRIMYIMPLVFLVMFWRFPAGLVLYWLTNSTISIITQYFVIRKDEARVKHA